MRQQSMMTTSGGMMSPNNTLTYLTHSAIVHLTPELTLDFRSGEGLDADPPGASMTVKYKGQHFYNLLVEFQDGALKVYVSRPEDVNNKPTYIDEFSLLQLEQWLDEGKEKEQ